MRITDRLEHDGSWWGRRDDGRWLRWDPARNRWEGPVDPPWPGAGVPDGSGSAGRPPPANPLDAWFNRTFPPWSGRRLLFGVVGVALMGWLLGAAGGSALPTFLFVTVAGGFTLAIAFLPSVRKSAGPALRMPHQDADLPSPFGVPAGFGRDLVIALPFSSAIVAIVIGTVSGLDELLTTSSLLTILVGGLVTGLVVALRTTAWSLIIVSLLGGSLGGLATVALSVMTFSEPDGFLVGWAIGSALCFVFLFPTWQGVRRMEARGLRLPMWVVMSGATLLTAGASLMFVAE